MPRRPGSVRLRAGMLAAIATALLGADAFVLGRQVFLSGRAARSIARRSPAGRSLLVHELAHVDQYRRHGVVRFLALYLSDYVAGRGRGLSHAQAYAAIAFEREAEQRASNVSREGFPGDRRRGG